MPSVETDIAFAGEAARRLEEVGRELDLLVDRRLAGAWTPADAARFLLAADEERRLRAVAGRGR